jgi:transposase
MGEGIRRIASDLGTCRNTVKRYRQWAREHGLLEGPELPSEKVIRRRIEATGEPLRKGPESSVEPHRAFVAQLRLQGVDATVIHQRLKEEKGFLGSYSAIRRFIRQLPAAPPKVVFRVETAPAQEAQVDFGYAGMFPDPDTGKLRRAWLFVMTLCFSRHMYAEVVFDQKMPTWLALHVRAFEYFGGVVRRVVIDNLKSAIARAVFHDAEATKTYREFAEHYGFFISPCRPRTPEHKGKVERMVQYVRRSALAGREFKGLEEVNAHLKRWLIEHAGIRIHGTTGQKPLERFMREKGLLGSLPDARYEVVLWKQAKVHPDSHVTFLRNFYSVPYRLIGRQVWLKVLPMRIEIYYEHERVATHVRAAHPHNRVTLEDHLPAERLQAVMVSPQRVRRQAEEIGPCAIRVVEHLLEEKPMDRLRTAQAILGLVKKHGAGRLEAACRRALAFADLRYHTIRTILKKGLDLEPLEEATGPLPRTSRFARPAQDLDPNASI